MGVLREVTRAHLVLLVAVIIAASAQTFEENDEEMIGGVKRGVEAQEELITKRGWPSRPRTDRWSRQGGYRFKREVLSKREKKLDLNIDQNGYGAEASYTRGNHKFSGGVRRTYDGRNSYNLGYERSFAGGRGKFNVGVQGSRGSKPSFGVGVSIPFGKKK